MAVWSVCGHGLILRPIGCTPALSVTQKLRCSCGMRLVALYKTMATFDGMAAGQNPLVRVWAAA